MKKRFEVDQPVMIRREPGRPWTPARYRGPCWPGWHGVDLPEARHVDRRTGFECADADPGAMATTHLVVPSQRIRARERVRFFLQPTKTFDDGAPQRESYETDEAFDAACARYAAEWRQEYECVGCEGAARRDCPQHAIKTP